MPEMKTLTVSGNTYEIVDDAARKDIDILKSSQNDVIPISRGGTGATDAAAACKNLGALRLDPDGSTEEGSSVGIDADTLNGMTYENIVEDVKEEVKSDITYSDVGAASSAHTHTGMYTTSNLKFSLSGTTLTITKS